LTKWEAMNCPSTEKQQHLLPPLIVSYYGMVGSAESLIVLRSDVGNSTALSACSSSRNGWSTQIVT
jgi:hypothetical protein